MSYSDEPNVISEQTRSKKIYFQIGVVALFIVLLASVAFFPRILDFQRRNATIGPNEGNVYFISLEGNRHSMELARPESLDFRMCVFIHPTRDRTPWKPEEHQVGVTMEGMDEVAWLQWDPELGFFGPSEEQFHPRGDYRFAIEVKRGEKTVWSGSRWSFRVGAHAH